MKNIIVVGAGDIEINALNELCKKKKKETGEWGIIAADGGNDYLLHNQIEPDYRIGDWDSAKEKPVTDTKKTIVLPTQKDDTDLLAAIRLGMENGGTAFHILGSLGGARVDHSFASIQCLIFLKKNHCDGYIYHNHSVITLIQDEAVEFPSNMEGYFSVFAVSENVKHVTIQNAAYEVEDVCFTNDYPIGVSNEFIGKKTFITANDGILAIIYPHINAEIITRREFQS